MEESTDSYEDYAVNGDPWAQEKHQSLRRKIKYYFMNPCEKFYARGRKPWKLGLQLVKIVIITIQLVSFGLSNQMVVTFKEENLQTFKHLFLKDYSDGHMDNYAVYRQADTYKHIEYVIEQYRLLHNTTVGNHEYEKNGTRYTSLELCQAYYRNGTIYPGNETFEIDADVQNDCYDLYPMYPRLNNSLPDFEIYFKRMLWVTMTFVLKAINLQTVRHRELPDCYDFTVLITYDNQAHSGRIKIDLDTDVEIKECRDWKVTGASPRNMTLTVLFDCLIIITCITSFSLCLRSVLTGIRLQQEYIQHCKSDTLREVPWSDKMEFINGWYILIIVSDTLSIIGSILKIAIQTKVLTNYDVCSIFLGTGTMFVWIGVVRYLGYFRKYNILILTLRAAFPNVIRFICCAGIIYVSYCFCGWIVLGPYHEKFRTLNTVSECLFSLINGDDMFPTFKDMGQKSKLVWVFSRVYLYTFVSLFIYMVLSLFITIITDTYDTIKVSRLVIWTLETFSNMEYALTNEGLHRAVPSSHSIVQQQQNGVPTSDLQKFLSECNDSPNSGVYRLEEERKCFMDCCIDPRLWFRNPQEPLVSDA